MLRYAFSNMSDKKNVVCPLFSAWLKATHFPHAAAKRWPRSWPRVAAGGWQAQRWRPRPRPATGRRARSGWSCPLGPGTSVDTLARLVARALSDALGQSVLVENRAGASGNIAAETVARAPPDGHTLLLGTASLAILPVTLGARAVDPEQALLPVSILVTQALIIAAHPSFPGSTFADIVRMAKEKPDTIAFSTSGVGGGPHLAAAWAMTRAGIRLVHIPYTANRALIDVLSGEIPARLFVPGNGAADDTFGTAQRHRGDQREAARRGAGDPDAGRIGSSGIRGDELARDLGARRHTASISSNDCIMNSCGLWLRRKFSSACAVSASNWSAAPPSSSR